MTLYNVDPFLTYGWPCWMFPGSGLSMVFTDVEWWSLWREKLLTQNERDAKMIAADFWTSLSDLDKRKLLSHFGISYAMMDGILDLEFWQLPNAG